MPCCDEHTCLIIRHQSCYKVEVLYQDNISSFPQWQPIPSQKTALKNLDFHSFSVAGSVMISFLWILIKVCQENWGSLEGFLFDLVLHFLLKMGLSLLIFISWAKEKKIVAIIPTAAGNTQLSLYISTSLLQSRISQTWIPCRLVNLLKEIQLKREISAALGNHRHKQTSTTWKSASSTFSQAKGIRYYNRLLGLKNYNIECLPFTESLL